METGLVSRRSTLLEALPACWAMVHRRRACDVPAGHIDDYVALDWMEWHGGSLRLTTVGENILLASARAAR